MTIGPAPFAMRHRLRLAGIRPINNVVDATNYVMWETGQPLHAFDLDTLRGEPGAATPAIVVRPSREGESMTTLDAVERPLATGTLLICDGAGPVALAGVMGGLQSEVTDKTRRVLIEAAQFDRTSIRVTAIGQRLPSEASLRFGRGVPAAGSLDAARRAAELMRRHAGGSIARGVVDVYPRPQQVAHGAAARRARSTRVLGTAIPAAEVRRILVSLGCTVRPGTAAFAVGIPADAPRPRDPRRPGRGGRAHHRLPPHPERADVRRVRAAAAEPGDGRRGPRPRRARRLRPDRGDHLLAHRPGLVHAPRPRGGRQRLRLPRQPDDRRSHAPAPPHPAGAARDAAATTCGTSTASRSSSWRASTSPRSSSSPRSRGGWRCCSAAPSALPWWGNQAPPPYDFFHAKGILETLAERLNVGPLTFAPYEGSPYQSGRAAVVSRGDETLGTFGELDPALRHVFDLPERRVVLGEFDAAALLAGAGLGAYRTLSRYPALTQDLAIVCPEEMPAARIEETVRAAAGDLLASLRLFDVYRGEPLPAGTRSLAFTLTFQALDRTLAEDDVQPVARADHRGAEGKARGRPARLDSSPGWMPFPCARRRGRPFGRASAPPARSRARGSRTRNSPFGLKQRARVSCGNRPGHGSGLIGGSAHLPSVTPQPPR